jgi:hypothetical protein
MKIAAFLVVLFTSAEFLPMPAHAQVQLAWADRYSTGADSTEGGFKVRTDSDGYVYALGGGGNAVSNGITTIKYSPDGSKVWKRLFDDKTGLGLSPQDIQIDSAGNVFVLGYSADGTKPPNYAPKVLLFKYDAQGRLVWKTSYDGPNPPDDQGEYLGQYLRVDRSGNLYAAGRYRGVNDYDYMVLKFSPQGKILWDRRYNGPVNSVDLISGLELDSRGWPVVTGQSASTTVYDFYTIKYKPDGQVAWENRYDRPDAHLLDAAFGLTIAPDDSVVVVGGSDSPRGRGNVDLTLLKYGRKGALLWDRIYDGSGFDAGSLVTTDPAGNIFVVGNTIGPFGLDILIQRYTPKGRLVWTQRYDGPVNYNDYPTGIGLTAQGDVRVSGLTRGSNRELPNLGIDFDYTVLAYSAAGAKQWEFRYNGPFGGEDTLTSMAIGPNGRIYVTGSSVRAPGYQQDMTTLGIDDLTQGLVGADAR